MAAIALKIPDELFDVSESFSFSGTYDLPQLATSADLYRFDEPLQWSIYMSNTGEEVYVGGTVTGPATTDCARCLEPFTFDIEGEVEGFFFLEDPGDDLPEGLEADEVILLNEDHVIDIEPLILAAIRLDLPLMPICSDDCKGICPMCGTNLNEETCSCVPDTEEFEEAANPFAALKGYSFEGSKEDGAF